MPRKCDWTGLSFPFPFFCWKHWKDLILLFCALNLNRKFDWKFECLLTPPILILGTQNFFRRSNLLDSTFMSTVVNMLFYLLFLILHQTSFGACHYQLLAFVLKMSQQFLICDESLIFVTLGMRTAFKSNFHHHIFEFKVGASEIRLLFASWAVVTQIAAHAPPAIERVTVLAADWVIYEHCAYWAAPLLLVFLICKLN